MKRLSPAPISTPISSKDGNLNIPWMHWIRESSDAQVESTTTKDFNASGLKYVNLGKICFVYFSGMLSSGVVALPYTSEIDKYLAYTSNGVSGHCLLTKGGNSITLPTGTNVILSDFYFVSL